MKIFFLFLCIFALLSTESLAKAKRNFSGCIPNQDLKEVAPLMYQIDNKGKLVVDRNDQAILAIGTDEENNTDYIRKNIKTVKGAVEMILKRDSNGYPIELQAKIPKMSKDSPAYSETIRFEYDGKRGDGINHCHIKDSKITLHDGLFKDKPFVYYSYDLCNKLNETLDAKTNALIEKCGSVLQNIQESIHRIREKYKEEGADLYDYYGDDSTSTLSKIISTVNRCDEYRKIYFPNYAYPVPAKDKGITIPIINRQIFTGDPQWTPPKKNMEDSR